MELAAALAALAAALLGPTTVLAQSVVLSATSDLTLLTGSRTQSSTRPTIPPTGAYLTHGSKITLTGTSRSSPSTPPSPPSSTASNSTAPATPQNTQPCNNHVEFCRRRYSNITNVGAHNSPFVRPGNSGSNQQLPVTTQLDDGIRLLQAQMHWPANSLEPHFCHTSCDILDAGPITRWLGQVKTWVDAHPYDVVTILLGNGNYSSPDLHAPYIEQTGITKYAYRAPFLPMALADWPTLGDMIVRGSRVVLFLDYMADQKKYPWLLDEFSNMWETPFDPQDRAFPCTVQRPPDLKPGTARDRLYLMNHNLNVEFSVFGAHLLVPAVALLNDTNAASGPGSLGLAANNCRSAWGRPPNFVNVDYYNYGTPPGSVFEAAARVNNVTYNRTCCGNVSAAPPAPAPWTGLWWALLASSTVLASLVL